jgi:hypothetical protein
VGCVAVPWSATGLVLFTFRAQRPHGESVWRGVLVVILVCGPLEMVGGVVAVLHNVRTVVHVGDAVR